VRRPMMNWWAPCAGHVHQGPRIARNSFGYAPRVSPLSVTLHGPARRRIDMGSLVPYSRSRCVARPLEQGAA
jgi:hypothetical protein